MLFLNGNETTRPYRVAPLGLAYVASATRAAGYDVRFLDFPSTSRERRRFEEALVEWPADYLAVGIRNLDNSDFHGFESYLRGPAELVAVARRIRPDLPVIVGGPAATVDPDLVMAEVQPDYVVLGEGEESMPALLGALVRGDAVSGIFSAGDEPASRTPFRVADTGMLVAPRLYEWLPRLRPYLRGDAGYPLQTKRGCPLRCTYCTYGRIEGMRYRFLSPTAIADEVEGALERGVRDFEFVDSTFNLPPRHALAVLAELQRRNLRANYIGTGLNPSKLPDELLAGMREVGFRSVILTAESASEVMLRSYRKNYTVGHVRAAAEALRKHDIKALWVFLIGGPAESPETVEETLAFIDAQVHPPHAVYITSGIRIYPGAPIADQIEEGDLVREDLRTQPGAGGTQFFYSHATPPEWLGERLRAFQRSHPHVMLSHEGHLATTQLALRAMEYLPFRKPYWQYIPALNRARLLLFGN